MKPEELFQGTNLTKREKLEAYLDADFIYRFPSPDEDIQAMYDSLKEFLLDWESPEIADGLIASASLRHFALSLYLRGGSDAIKFYLKSRKSK